MGALHPAPPIVAPTAAAVTDPVAIAKERVDAIFRATNALLVAGHKILVVGSEMRTFPKPVLWVANDPRLSQMVAEDRAVYYLSGNDVMGHYRVGQFDLDGVTVMWVERGH